jgi:uncharacterized protein (DUF924 family)
MGVEGEDMEVEQGLAEEIHAFWFADSLESVEKAGARNLVWFAANQEFDESIRARFGELPDRAAAGELDDWQRVPRSCLALVLVLDQLPRNLFRGSTRAFEFDARAREVAAAAIEAGHDGSLHPLEATFLYLPFEHSEVLADQERCLSLYRGLEERAPAPFLGICQSASEYARRHHAVVERFGRFPHRNETLGRASTAEENDFLASGGDGF